MLTRCDYSSCGHAGFGWTAWLGEKVGLPWLKLVSNWDEMGESITAVCMNEESRRVEQ
jgi:hypothetical protein